MATLTNAPTTVQPDAAATVQKLLQDTVTDLIALALNTKQLHWNIQGPRFQSIHELLDVLYAEYLPQIDELAERVAAVGHPVDGRPAAVAEHTGELEVPAGFVRDDDVIEWQLKGLESVIHRVRPRQEALGEVDAPSEDMLITLLQILEKQAWMLRSQK
jgi:starvation-inducible DNA-binding protein